MGLLLPALFILVVVSVVTAVWIGLVVLCVIGWKKKRPWLKWLAGISATFMAVGGLLIGGLLAYGFFVAESPPTIFKNTFGESPTAKVSEIQGSLNGWTDSVSVYLRFKTTEEEFRRLMPKNMIECSISTMKEETPSEYGSEPPTWWDYQLHPKWTYFLRTSRKPGTPSRQGFLHEIEYFAYDPDNQRAYFRFSGIE